MKLAMLSEENAVVILRNRLQLRLIFGAYTNQ
jgi:hypothetical protein